MFKLKAKEGGQWRTIGVASVFTDANGNDGLTCELLITLSGWDGRFIAVADANEATSKMERPVTKKAKPQAKMPSQLPEYGDPLTNPAKDEDYEAGWRYCPKRKGGHLWNIYTEATALIPKPKKRPEEYPDSKCEWHHHGPVEKPTKKV